ncbi:MAG: DUF1064 domain-containing protein [Clostridia bacterium]|nr:DUF1064 domain-containing protein [Clostridia bacterium]
MAIELEDLPPKYQAQVRKQLGIEEKQKKNKYGAEKATIDGQKFDSTKEARRYAELKTLERIGEIQNLRSQVPYELIPKQKKADGSTERACTYIADFVYDRAGKTVVEDVKGYKNPASPAYAKFVIKRKLMLYKYGIEVSEV